MKCSSLIRFFFLFMLSVLLLGTGCTKKSQPIVRAPTSKPTPAPEPSPPASAPTIEISATPSTVKRGQEINLAWNSSNADSILIDAGVGNVPSSGDIRVTPLESTTYTAIATGRGGEARASTRVTVVRDEERPKVTVTDVEALKRAIEEGQVRPIFFDYDSSDISAQSKRTLEQNARVFRSFPNAQLIIEGHCDERGTEEYNLALGDRRAQATQDYLIQLGVSSRRLEAVSFGEERPFVAGHTEAAWAKNRRAHFVVR